MKRPALVAVVITASAFSEPRSWPTPRADPDRRLALADRHAEGPPGAIQIDERVIEASVGR